MFSNYHISDSYKECLVKNLKIYNQNSRICNARMYFGALTTAIEMSNPRDEVYEEFKSLRNYKKYINNTKPAESLESLDPKTIRGFDNYANCVCDKAIKMIDKTEVQNIKSGKTLLRVNDKNQVIYTVSKVGDRFAFKNFSLIQGWPGPGYSLKLFLNSIWYDKQLPNVKDFKNIHPYVSSLEDVMKIDPNFRCIKKGETLYSTHVFAEGKGYVITIEYYKNYKGIYRVKDVTSGIEGLNLLPCLLPIDRKLIDPSYIPEPEEDCTPEDDSEILMTIPEKPYCSIM